MSGNKYTRYAADRLAVRDYLKKNTATATMTSVALDLYRPNVCRIKRELEKHDLLKEVFIARCKITKHRAAYLSTNPKIMGGKNGK